MQNRGGAAVAAPPDAVVVGLCPHGLAVARSLALRGLAVLALEPQGRNPGVRTRFAQVLQRGPINGHGLAQTLLAVAEESGWSSRPVLFLTNDNMVRNVAEHAHALAERYRWSWQDTAPEILRLLNKQHLPEACAGRAVLFPVTATLAGPQDLEAVIASVPMPAMAKPAWPLGSFKATVVRSKAELERLVQDFARSLPFVVQQWIEGTVETLRFGVAYLDRGRVLASFEGRKAYAGPDGLGQATTMEPWPDPAVRDATVEFLRDRDLSGPVAVEFKRDADGRLWMIEPNVGRTEYCVDVCIGNGFDLPWFEYCHVAGRELPTAANHNRSIWFDCDRDRLSWVRYLARNPSDPRAYRPLFPFAGHGDPGPLKARILRR
jgi:predicted ATP-grasp superfamily ATP-dependent carboligase